ncbi:MAG: HIT family protein [Candidatus Paceibacteria bacterium]
MTTNETSIFTKIITREIPADIVYEDETVIAFLTIEPINPGHTLIVPKKPFVNIFDGEEKGLSTMMVIAKKISNALIVANLATAVNLIMNNGTDAGQEVFHAHLHVVPRLKNDEALLPPKHTVTNSDERKIIATTIVNHLESK